MEASVKEARTIGFGRDLSHWALTERPAAPPPALQEPARGSGCRLKGYFREEMTSSAQFSASTTAAMPMFEPKVSKTA